jgi:hypothetical protein
MDESTSLILCMLGIGAILGAAIGIAICDVGRVNNFAVVVPISSFLGANVGFVCGLIFRRRSSQAARAATRLPRVASAAALAAGAGLLVFMGAQVGSLTFVFWGLLVGLASFLPPALGTKRVQERLVGAAMSTLSIVAFAVTREFSWLIIAALSYFAAYATFSHLPPQKRLT